jgi:histidyl-tRNA synthetase
MGLERLLTLMPPAAADEARPVYVLPVLDDDAGTVGDAALKLARDLRAAGRRVEVEGRKVRMKTALPRAEKLGARFVAIVGAKEAAAGLVSIKDLERREQQEIPASEVVGWLSRAVPLEAPSLAARSGPGTP